MKNQIDDAKLILKKNGKSFFWASKFLPSLYVDRASELYKFCRILDDIADSGKKNSLVNLQKFHSQFKKNDIVNFNKLNNYFLKCPEYFNPNSKKAVLNLLDGLIFDQKTVLIKDESDLICYSYQVAGTVGIMMCDALQCHNEKAKLFAVDLGIAMQLTNIARDVLEDAKMGRRYLPGSWVNGFSPEEIVLASKNNNHVKNNIISIAVERLLTLAEKYYLSGSQGFVYLPIKTRFAIAIASSVYREIGIQLKRKKYNWYNGRQVTTTGTKLKVSIKNVFLELASISKREVDHNTQLHEYLKDML